MKSTRSVYRQKPDRQLDRLTDEQRFAVGVVECQSTFAHAPHYGSEQLEYGTSNLTLSLELGSE